MGAPAAASPGVGTRVVAVLAFTAVVLRSLARDRTAMFVMLLLPVGLIILVGATYGGTTRLPVGVTGAGDGVVSRALLDALGAAPGLTVQQLEDADPAAAVRRSEVVAAVVLPPGFDQAVLAGRQAQVVLVADAGGGGGASALLTLRGIVDAVSAPFTAAQFSAERTGGTVANSLPGSPGSPGLAGGVAGDSPPALPVTVRVEDIADGQSRDVSQFTLTAARNLVLFVFINTTSVAGMLVQARRAGVFRRAVAARTGLPALLAGLGLGWLALALLQSLLIIVVGVLLFGVSWGDPVAAALLVFVFAAVGCGAGLLVGALGRDPDRVSSIAPVVGIVMGALGGCMVPLEIFPPAMLAVAHATPQFWAVSAWEKVALEGAGSSAIVESLAVLAVLAVVLVGAATAALRRDLTQA